MVNYRQLYAKKKMCENRLKLACNGINNESGIYILTREDNDGLHAYIGQAKHLIDRLSSHLMGYSQRIDISLKKRGFAYEYFGGWELSFINCSIEELDEYERKYIKHYQELGYKLYNITSGGQNEGKTDINERKPTKTYRDGLKQGYSNCIKEIQPLLVYLDIKVKKNNKISQRMLEKFEKILKKG